MPTASTESDHFDIIIRSGTVVDGTGSGPVQADVGVKQGLIAKVGDLSAASAGDVIEAQGLVVTPGLIDVHSHSDITLVVDGRAQSALTQGVTTELVGNCGHGCFPLGGRPEFAENIFGYDSSMPLDWQTAAEYFNKLEAARPAINIGTLVPLGNLRLATMDNPEVQASPAQLRAMHALLESGLEEGAFGLSVGLQYPDSVATSPVELVELAEAVAARDGLYAACVRHTDERAEEGIAEPIDTGVTTGVRVQISHAMPQPGSPTGMTRRTYELVESGRAAGVDVAFDMHTRPWGELNLSAALPVWALAGSPADVERRLGSTADRERIKAYPGYVRRFVLDPGPDKMRMVRTRDKSLIGKSLSDLTPSGADPLDTILDILRQEVDDIHRPQVVIEMYPEDELAAFYAHPLCAIGSDSTTMSPDGPLANAIFYGAFTWASWFLRHIVCERRPLTLAEGIRRVTSLPAERIGLKDRGIIREGARADIAAFDMANVSERGTFEEPNQFATGTIHVLVNGTLALRNGVITDVRAGAVLKAH